MKKMFVRSSILALASVLLLAPASFALQGAPDAVDQAQRELDAPTTATDAVMDTSGPSLLDLVVGFLLGPVYNSDGPVNNASPDPQPNDKGPLVDPVGQQAP